MEGPEHAIALELQLPAVALGEALERFSRFADSLRGTASPMLYLLAVNEKQIRKRYIEEIPSAAQHEAGELIR